MDKYILMIFLILSSLTVKAESSYLGNWKGYCGALFKSLSSHLCLYKFNEDKTGSYSCEKFKDLRCLNSTNEKTNLKFTFEEIKTSQKYTKLKVMFSSGDFAEELYLIKVKENLLSLTSIEALKRGEKLPFKGRSPPYYFTHD